MTKFSAALVCLMIAISSSFSQPRSARTFEVRSFGAKGDGVTLDTKAIQQAVDQCAETGGIIVFSPGAYLTGSVELKSNVELQIQTGATILGSKNLSDYFERTPKLNSYNNVFLKHSLFYAEGQTNIAITGKGTIDGQGASFKVLTKEKPARYKNRPFIIRFIECKNVSIEDITLRSSAMWMQHYLACDAVRIRGIRVFNHANQNNDMMDIDGCQNVVISDCIGDTDDDGITLKSTSNRITENVAITNCVISSHCNALKTGTESTGGFRNITVSNIVIKPSAVQSVISGKPGGNGGISLTLVDGGTLDGVSISNVLIDGPEVPIFIRLGNRGRKAWEGAPQPGIGILRNVDISHVIARNVKSTGCSISGLEGHPVENISLSDIRLEFAGGVQAVPNAHPAELEDQYPESTMWGTLPAYGFFIRHAKGLHLRDLQLNFAHDDVRPVLHLNDVVHASISHLDATVSSDAGATIVLEKVDGLMLSGSVLSGNSSALINLVGNGGSRILLSGNDLSNVKKLCDPESALGKAVSVLGDEIIQK